VDRNCANNQDGSVTCDSVTYSCPTECSGPSCETGPCFSSVQCYSICSAGGEPSSYICDRSVGCCVCVY
jgi:hypothetical protein